MGADVVTHGGKGAQGPVPAAPDGLGAVQSAAWTDLCSPGRAIADKAVLISALAAAIGVSVGLASAFPRHASAILIAGSVGAGVLGAAAIVWTTVASYRGGRVTSLLVLRVPRAATWVGDEAAAYQIGARARVVRYEDVAEVRNDINVDVQTDKYGGPNLQLATYRFATRVIGRDGKVVCSWRATLRADATSEEQLAQVSSAHPIHFALAMRKAWEAWRTRNRLPI